MAEIETINGFDIAPNGYVKQISLDELATVGAGTYTLGTVQVDEPIRFPRQLNRDIIIVDTVFNINTEVMFPPYNTSYFILPSFVGCSFINKTNGRVMLCGGDNNIIGSRVTGCNFYGVDMSTGGYLQDFNFANCYIKSYDTFLDSPNSTVQARFVNCNVESESNGLVKADNGQMYFSGVYEGNAAKDFYFVDVSRSATLTFESCWFESAKMLHVSGGDAYNYQVTVSLNGCHVNGATNSIPTMLFDHPEFVNLFVNGSKFAPYNSGSRFTNALPDAFKQLAGSFANNAVGLPFGGEAGSGKRYATADEVAALENKRFIDRKLLLSQAVIDGGGITMTDLPVGGYLVLVGQGDYSNFSSSAMYTVTASIENSTIARAIKIIDGTTAYTNNYTLTPTKANASDTTFSLNINTTVPQGARICMIRIF